MERERERERERAEKSYLNQEGIKLENTSEAYKTRKKLTAGTNIYSSPPSPCFILVLRQGTMDSSGFSEEAVFTFCVHSALVLIEVTLPLTGR